MTGEVGDTSQSRERIDRSSPTPLYHQLEQIVRADIRSGTYRAGDLLPSESEICDRYDVSRSVVRQTLQNLAHTGLIHTERGRGSFVAEAKLSERFVQRNTGFYDDLTRMGLDIQTRVVRQELAEVPLEVGEFLGVDEAVRIDRVRSVAGRVLAYVVTYISALRCPDLDTHDLGDRSLYAHLDEAYGLRVHAGYRTVEAVPAEDDAAGYLEVEGGTPLLLLRSAGRTADGRPLEWFEAWHRADRTRFEVEIVPGETARPFQQTVITSRAHGSDGAGPLSADDERHGPRDDGEFDQRLRDDRVVAVVRAPEYGDGASIAGGLAAGGVTLVEFTLTGANALEAIAQARLATDAVVGIGSVRTVADARRAVDAGAQFVVSPARISALATAELGVPVVLAGLTPSEVMEAHELTGRPVKVFPASVGGVSYLRALAAPLPDVPLMPSGGVDAGNVTEFLAAGAVAVNVGSSLCPVAAVRAGDAAELERRARDLRTAIDDGAAR